MSRPVRSLLTVLMDLLVIVAAVLVLRSIVVFFGVLASQAWGKAVASLTTYLVLPLRLQPISTPYGGTFGLAAAVTVLVLLAVEWALGIARRAS
jgi:hypothetical protein